MCAASLMARTLPPIASERIDGCPCAIVWIAPARITTSAVCEGVKPFQRKLVQIYLIGLGGQLLPERPCDGFRRILDEIVAPDLPGNQHGVIGTRPSQPIEQGDVIRWQLIENAVAILNDERIQKDHSRYPIEHFFRDLLNDRSSETMADQNDSL